MKIIKYFIYLIFTIIILSVCVQPQERDSLIHLYPGLSDTVDQFDASYFELFQNIAGFEYAVFYIRNNQKLVSKVTYSENGKTRDTTFIQQLSALDDVRKNIEEIEKENEKKHESPREFNIETKNGDKYICDIEMFSKNDIYFSTEENLFSEIFNTSKFKMKFSKVETLTLVGETNTWSCMGYGALIGLGVGLTIAIASSGDDYSGLAYLIGIPFFTIVGGVAGLLSGFSQSSGDEVYPIDYRVDLLQLKPFVKYYFRHNESLEKQYIEME